ncbi:Wzz/FepE/Etk N-terminal domain-containing protein, partial [Enterobacter cloacae complex sp. IR5403]|uniref:Wzz/FepE/Etk N-terminal domain-containing protein n=1 Tax=Enterobacter cloacae complex sp. IR5403 TaxID=3412359 RepID=UPI003BA7FB86
MTQNNDSLVNRSNDPEQIDLLDLVVQLWRGKWVIGAFIAAFIVLAVAYITVAKEGANKRGNSSRLTQSFHFFMFEPIFSPVNALNQP